MDQHAELYQIAKLILAAADEPEAAAEQIFRRAVERTGAERGFIVVRQGGSYEQKFDVAYARERLSADERRFSRTLVRRAIETRAVISSESVADDARFADTESVVRLADSAVLAAPLVDAGGEVHAVIYLERAGRGAFPPDAQAFLSEFAEISALILRRAIEQEALRQRSRSLERDLFAQHDFGGIVTRHPAMLSLLKMVVQVADSDATVLIRGETGTGKELIARALHLNSGRRARPFVVLHCTALAGTLLESELFGHVRGAFTGADRERTGRLASADGGTLFLDEIAELPNEVQVKLLRFLQFGEIQRVGSDKVEKVNVRVVAATHQDLPAWVAAGKFRQDLLFRLKVIELQLPPLRERRGDIPLLVARFLSEKWKRPGPPPRFTHAAEDVLERYAYPGNIRELAHLVERACLLATGPELDLSLLPPEVAPKAPTLARETLARFTRFDGEELNAAKEAAVAEVERQFLEGLMRRADGNVSQASRLSGIHRSFLQKLLARHRPSDS
jgi:transcriptional regulator with GAF, ATPase, and Fis domain